MVDVTVRGAGIFGLSVAWACARRGASVRVVDPKGVAAGASGGIVGALAPHVPEQWNAKKAFQLESLLMAEGWWRTVEQVSETSSGYGRTGRVQPVMAGGEALAQSRTIGAQDLWQGQAIWEVRPDRQGLFAGVTKTGLLIHDTLSARIHPKQACTALAAAITRTGGQIVEDAPDEGKVVWATGWQGLEALTRENGRLVGVGVKGQAVLLAHDAKDHPQLFIDGLHVIFHADGTTAIGSTTEREFLNACETDEQCTALLERARALVPELQTASELKRWAGCRPRSRTRAPMLGHHPFRKGAYIANGGFKIGFGMAPLGAERLADLVLEGKEMIPSEFAPHSSL